MSRGPDKQFDPEAALQKAMEVFWAKGYTATSIQDLVEATGLQRGSLYGAFGDKHGLYLAALDAYLAGGTANFESMLDGGADPLDAVRNMVRTVADQATGPRAALGCMVANTCSELAPHDEVARDRVQAFAESVRSRFARALRAAQEHGSFSRDRDAEAVAAHIHCTLQGLALMGKSDTDPATLRHVVDEILAGLD